MKRFIFKNLLMTAVTILSLGVMCFVTDIRDKDIELEEEAADEAQTEKLPVVDMDVRLTTGLLTYTSYKVYGAICFPEKKSIVVVTPDEQQIVLDCNFEDYCIELSVLDIDHDGTKDAVLGCRKKDSYKLYFIVNDNNEYKVYSSEDLSNTVKNDINLYKYGTDGEVVITKLSSGEKIKYYQKVETDYRKLYFDYCHHTKVDPDNNLIHVYPSIYASDYHKNHESASCVIYYRFSLHDDRIDVEFINAAGYSECFDQSGNIECYRYLESDGFVFDDEMTRYEELYGLSDYELIESNEIYTQGRIKLIDVYHKEKDGVYFVSVRDNDKSESNQGWFEFARITGLSDIDNLFGGSYQIPANSILIQPFVFLTSSGEVLSDKVGKYREEREYDEKGNLVRFTSYGTIEGDGSADEYELLNREYSYNEENRLISWYQYEDYPWSSDVTDKSELFEDRYCNQRFICDDTGKTFFQAAVISLGKKTYDGIEYLDSEVYDFYYIYGNSDKPEYVICIPYDRGGMEMFKYPDMDVHESVEWHYKDYNEAFAGALRMDDQIWDAENGKWCFIDNFEYYDHPVFAYDDDLRWGKPTFSVVDLDGDGECEVVIYNHREDRLILHYVNGRIYGYLEFFRGFAGIKQNGYYHCSYDGSLSGYMHISEFLENDYKEQFLVWQDKNLHNGQKDDPEYYYCGEYDHSNPWDGELFGGEQITEEQYLKIVDDVYESSPDVEVYELTEENIDRFFGAAD